MKQTTNTVFLIRPGNFVFNTQTAASNAFQHQIKNETAETIKQKVFAEFELFAQKLKSKGISKIPSRKPALKYNRHIGRMFRLNQKWKVSSKMPKPLKPLLKFLSSWAAPLLAKVRQNPAFRFFF